jgi:DNA-binding MarR family transcriptional regulator
MKTSISSGTSASAAAQKLAKKPEPAIRPRQAQTAKREPMLPGHLDHGRMKRLLGYNLAQAAIPTFKIFDKYIGEPFDLRRLDFTILMLVASNPQLTQQQMSLALDVAAPRLTIVCDKLVERGLITRTRSEVDRRKQFIGLSRKGAALVRKTDAVAEDMEAELLGHLTELERSMLFQLLEKIAIHRRV